MSAHGIGHIDLRVSMKAIRAISITTLMVATMLVPIGRGVANPATPGTAATPTVIHTRAELQRYLKDTPAWQSPLSLLPRGARARFLDTLVWGSKGIDGFVMGDLQQYLTDAQIGRVLSLFDLQDYAMGLHGRGKPLTAAERAAPETPLERKFDKLYFARQDAAHGGPHISVPALYDELLAPYQRATDLAGLDDSDVGLLFRGADDAAFASHDGRYLDDLRLDLAELHRRDLATVAQISGVHDQLVAARRFDTADAFAKQYPGSGITPLPPLRQAPGLHGDDPTVLVMRPDGKSMLHKPIDMQAPLRIVVVAGCHFSEDAARAIRADPELDRLFHEHAVWLAGENESLTDVLKWNREFPDQLMNVAWRDNEWHMLDSWRIPTFYVFHNGTLVDQWSGWPADTGMHTLRAHLRKDDLLP